MANDTDKNLARRIEDQRPAAAIDWSKPGAPAVPLPGTAGAAQGGNTSLEGLTRYHHNAFSKNVHTDPCGEYFLAADVERLFASIPPPTAPAPQPFSEQDIPADAPRAFAKRYSALLEENIRMKAALEAAPAPQTFTGIIDAGAYDRETGMMYVTVKLPGAGLPTELRTIGAPVTIAVSAVQFSTTPAQQTDELRELTEALEKRVRTKAALAPQQSELSDDQSKIDECVLNEAAWKFIDNAPNGSIPAVLWNNLKAALRPAIELYLAKAAPAAPVQTAEGVTIPHEVVTNVQNALSLAMSICDAVPNRAHNLPEGEPLRNLGMLVNYQEDTGAHGYAFIRDTQSLLLSLTAGDEQASGIPLGAALGHNGTVYHGIAEAWHQMEDAHALHQVLDDKQVPRADADGKVYSLFGRVARFAESVAASVQAEQAQAEPVAYLHQVVSGDGEPDQALSFAPDNFPLAGTLGYRSISHQPLYTAPVVALPAQAEQEAAVRAAYEKAAMVCQNMYEDGEGGAGCAVAADRIRALATKEAAAVEAPSQDQADAARYRWLRDYPWSFELPELAQIIQLQSNALWDSAIDAAMSGEQSPQSDMGGE